MKHWFRGRSPTLYWESAQESATPIKTFSRWKMYVIVIHRWTTKVWEKDMNVERRVEDTRGLIGCDPQHVGQSTAPLSLPWFLYSFNSSTYHSVQQQWWTQSWSVVTTRFSLATVRTSRRLRLIAGHGILMGSPDRVTGTICAISLGVSKRILSNWNLLFWERAKQSSHMIWSVLTRCGEPEASWLERSTNSKKSPVKAAHLDTLGFV